MPFESIREPTIYLGLCFPSFFGCPTPKTVFLLGLEYVLYDFPCESSSAGIIKEGLSVLDTPYLLQDCLTADSDCLLQDLLTVDLDFRFAIHFTVDSDL